MGDAGNRRLLGIICLIYTMVVLISGLWPFNFIPANEVEWIKSGDGIRFYGHGVVSSPEPLKMPGTSISNPSLTIEMLVQPNKESNKILESIFTLYDRDHEQFIFSQRKNNFNIRIPAEKDDTSDPFRYAGKKDVFKEETPYLLTVTSGQEDTNIYIDGNLIQITAHYALIPANRHLSGRIILGNSPNGRHPWHGSFLGLAIYDRTLDSQEILDHYQAWRLPGNKILFKKDKPIALYLFNEHGGELIQDHSGAGNHLLKPATFRPLITIMLEVLPRAYWFTYSNLMDVAVNIVGFVPFGFFLSAWLLQAINLSTRRVYWITLFLGFCISLSIELAQAYLPARDSSLLDLINNILGTAGGILFLQFFSFNSSE